MYNKYKKVAISVGPIPARLDSVKYITNRFKGGLAMKTAIEVGQRDHDVTIIAWTHTKLDIPEEILADGTLSKSRVVRVNDVYEYYDWFVAHAKDYDAFIMAAAVANLTPVKPYEGKFPSHNYKPGDEFDIRFTIAPRAIDAIKPINPRACLIGYKLFDADTDEELIQIARHTQADAKANIIFANTPTEAKSRKLAITPEGAVIECDFEQHIDLICQAIEAEYYHTEVKPLAAIEAENPYIQEALATVKLYEKTFNGYGTCAVPVQNNTGMFATTARGHKGGKAILVRNVDHKTRTIDASGKATLNAPALAALTSMYPDCVIMHRHFDDPRADVGIKGIKHTKYQFPGTVAEMEAVKAAATPQMTNDLVCTIIQPHHGYLKLLRIKPVDWAKYHETFPEKYFGIPENFETIVAAHEDKPAKMESVKRLTQFEFAVCRIADQGHEVLEIGGNRHVRAKYAYDPYVQAENAINLSWNEITQRKFELIFARNALNYLQLWQIETLLRHCDKFAANTFLLPPDKPKITKNEVSVYDNQARKIRHTLLLPDDSIVCHQFNVFTEAELRTIGLTVTPYGKNSALVCKGIEIETNDA